MENKKIVVEFCGIKKEIEKGDFLQVLQALEGTIGLKEEDIENLIENTDRNVCIYLIDNYFYNFSIRNLSSLARKFPRDNKLWEKVIQALLEKYD